MNNMSGKNKQIENVSGHYNNTFNTVKWCPRCYQYQQGNYCSTCGTALEDKQREVECPCCHGSGKITLPLNDTYWKALYEDQFGPKAVINGNHMTYAVNSVVNKHVDYDDNGVITNVSYKIGK